MTVAELLLLSVGLAADAFAASVCRGLAMKRLDGRRALLVAAFFGVFQMLMPLLGWLLGSSFSERIGAWDHWIAFLLLALIGGKMIRDSFAGEEEARPDDFSLRTLLLLAVGHEALQGPQGPLQAGRGSPWIRPCASAGCTPTA